MSRFVYTGARTGEISFPLGGIGTGCIGLAGNGALVDWEIFNRPGKGSLNGFSHFAIKAERRGAVLDARVLTGDYPPPYIRDKALAFANEKGRLALDRAARIRPRRAMVVRFTAPNQARKKKK